LQKKGRKNNANLRAS
jgi:hypothetical protein